MQTFLRLDFHPINAGIRHCEEHVNTSRQQLGAELRIRSRDFPRVPDVSRKLVGEDDSCWYLLPVDDTHDHHAQRYAACRRRCHALTPSRQTSPDGGQACVGYAVAGPRTPAHPLDPAAHDRISAYPYVILLLIVNLSHHLPRAPQSRCRPPHPRRPCPHSKSPGLGLRTSLPHRVF